MSAEEVPDSGQPTFGDTVFGNLFRAFVEPSLKARIVQGELPNPFPLSELRRLQILFSPQGGKPLVRINGEVRAIAQVRPKQGVAIEKGDPVSFDQIESIGAIGLADEEADFGHATFLREPNGGWVGHFDFSYYKGTARRHVDVAEEFLQAARYSREKQHWSAFADTLFSAAELAAKASLFCLDLSGDVAKSKKHGVVKALFNKQRHVGNVDGAHTTAFNRLWELRQTGRYVQEVIAFTEVDADALLNDVAALISAARLRASTFRSADSRPE